MNVVVANMAQKGAKINPCSMCSACAFKLNSAANLEPHNVEVAINSVLSPRSKFVCHQDKTKECAGYTMARALDE